MIYGIIYNYTQILEINSEMIQGFQYLYVGAYRQAERRKDFIYDDDGDNISVKTAIIVS